MSATLNQLLWLTTRSYLGEGAAQALVEHFGSAEAVYYADPSEYDMLRIPNGLKESLRDKSMDRAEQVLERCDRLGLWIMTYQDAIYPERLHQLRDYPLVLYGKGKRFRFDEELAVGMERSPPGGWAWSWRGRGLCWCPASPRELTPAPCAGPFGAAGRWCPCWAAALMSSIPWRISGSMRT